MGNLIHTKNIRNFINSKIGRDRWPIYSLFLEPLPILAIRNLNEYNDHYTEKDWHSTFSWDNKTKLRDAIQTAIPRLQGYGALRSNEPGGQRRLQATLKRKLPKILKRFQSHARRLKIRRLSDIKPNQRQYRDYLIAAANAVGEVSSTVKKVNTPMIGSKVMHFFLPEFFPIWDTAVVYKKALKYEKNLSSLPDGTIDNILTPAGKSYALYVHLLVTELSQASDRQRSQVLKSCIRQCAKECDVSVSQMWNVLDFHYDDLWPTVLEICLIGKHH